MPDRNHYKLYMRAFRKLERRLRTHRADVIAEGCIDKLHEVERRSPSDYGGWLPWHLLLVLRWGLEFGRRQGPSQPVTEQTLAQLVNLVHEMSGEAQAHLLDEPHGVRKWFRAIAYQQFWLQQGLRGDDLGRQWSLFATLDGDHALPRRFEEQAGLAVRDYLVMCMVLWSYVQRPEHPLFFNSSNLFVNTTVDEGQGRVFLDMLARDLDELHSFVAHSPVKSRVFQFGERSPFVQAPLIRVGDRYACASLRVLEAFLRQAIAIPLRSADAQLFGDRYGSVQEAHISRGLTALGFRWTPESTLKAMFPEGRRPADFACDRRLLGRLVVESKGVEPGTMMKVNPIAGVVEKDLGSHVIDGVQQCIETAHQLGDTAGDRVFAVVVTREEFVLSNGPSAWQELIEDVVAQRLSARGVPTDLVGPADVFILSLEEWDLLVGTNDSPDQVLAFLDAMGRRNQDPATARAFLVQHLEGLTVQSLEHVRTGFKELSRATQAVFLQSGEPGGADG